MDADSDTSFSDNEDNAGGEGSGAMMSIFASYYGIEDESSPGSKSAAELIDSAHFNSVRFVEEMLSTESAATLVAKDTSMIHEIRMLDSDMQMLVYENYNKFISATETIKRMKTNVEAMDDDMDAVRKKMVRITTDSRLLDDSLAEKRQQIDKFVRVRRLLQKLEFLSELPEKLVELINGGQYKRAVQLYGKTITVLTNHVHLLSFKKIKERTEQMMKDLRVKVMNLLDEPSLEAVKLTHYVTILRLMEAPKQLVIDKLLAAHNSRSRLMIDDFLPPEPPKPALSGHQAYAAVHYSKSEPGLKDRYLNTVSSARKFHQTMIVGFVEASKGVQELYDLSRSHDDELSRSVALEEVQAYLKLQAMIQALAPRCSECLLSTLKSFFCRYYAQLNLCDKLELEIETLAEVHRPTLAPTPATQNPFDEDDGEDSREEGGSHKMAEPSKVFSSDDGLMERLRTAQLELYDLEEEKSTWFLFIRQSLLDWEFLDANLKKCFPSHSVLDTVSARVKEGLSYQDAQSALESGSVIIPAFVGYASAFSSLLADVLTQHSNHMFGRTVLKSFSAVRSHTGRVLACVNVSEDVSSRGSSSTSAAQGSGSRSTDVSSHGGGLQDINRNLIQRKSQETKTVIEAMKDILMTAFSNLCLEMKPVFDVCVSTKNLELQHLLNTSELTWKFCCAICSLFESITGVRNTVAESICFDKDGCTSPQQDVDEGELVDDASVSARPWMMFHASNNVAKTSIDKLEKCRQIKSELTTDSDLYLTDMWTAIKFDGRNSDVNADFLISLQFAILFAKFNAEFLVGVQHELATHDLPSISGNIALKDCCAARISAAAKFLLIDFAQNSSLIFSERCGAALLSRFSPRPSSALTMKSHGNGATEFDISDDMMSLSVQLDHFVVACMIILCEVPSPPKPTTSNDREFSRRASVKRVSTAGLQLDIERLFSQRIEILKPESVQPNIESLTSIVLKACLKQALEALRCFVLPPSIYHGLQADVSLLKQIALSLLKEASECERLTDLVLISLFSRYTEANDIASASDSSEALAISRSISDCFNVISHRCFLISK